eukprot:CAMPEP_0175073912 /NCGR_PEP_ID=MMETSP0052_2-20121109/20899_1 /TAXON_ID=51329 ORGANISM="Polytomella parva, Strain SAG 63-3" /NCGR_SAMPLE_ID=MMETSP0052_2 /ASSEMBLY_ACC=CAM_ASM_000194 /LENGTH=73 /DNA_ID=CAMNT_0016341921 /DNA_START=197 /DNA_END=418 /DNA_ORIENTATION=+
MATCLPSQRAASQKHRAAPVGGMEETGWMGGAEEVGWGARGDEEEEGTREEPTKDANFPPSPSFTSKVEADGI